MYFSMCTQVFENNKASWIHIYIYIHNLETSPIYIYIVIYISLSLLKIPQTTWTPYSIFLTHSIIAPHYRTALVGHERNVQNGSSFMPFFYGVRILLFPSAARKARPFRHKWCPFVCPSKPSVAYCCDLQAVAGVPN